MTKKFSCSSGVRVLGIGLVVTLCFCSAPQGSLAALPNLFEAVTFGLEGNVVSYLGPPGGGAGWLFRPTERLRMVGLKGRPDRDSVIRIWSGTSNIVAEIPGPATYGEYQPIPPIELEPGRVYGMSLENPEPDFGPVSVEVYALDHPEIPTFAVSPFLEYLGSFSIGPSEDWINDNPPVVLGTTNYFLFGALFQFYVVPAMELSLTGTNTVLLTWSTPVASDRFEMQVANSLSSHWGPITNSISMSVDGKEIVLPVPDNNTFFRLIARE